jgi:hypothetical protein
MEYQRRIVPPRLDERPRRRSVVPSMSELDDAWDDLESTRPRTAMPKSKLALFPPARSDAEIEAIVDEFTAELTGTYY